jgi:hypothetical protein
MIWFGSSAGVALSNMLPDATNVFAGVQAGGHVSVANLVAVFAMLLIVQWHPDPPLRSQKASAENAATFTVQWSGAGGPQIAAKSTANDAGLPRARERRQSALAGAHEVGDPRDAGANRLR